MGTAPGIHAKKVLVVPAPGRQQMLQRDGIFCNSRGKAGSVPSGIQNTHPIAVSKSGEVMLTPPSISKEIDELWET